mmetsp:Transcript_4417/g.8515  ORF Transcript_4417/g.8515 Transcript_4417/m.8515 type:complete len:196 (+) Transcript_4417:2126-2713(+)
MIMTDELIKEFNARNLTIDMQIGLLRSAANDSTIHRSSSPLLSVKKTKGQLHNGKESVVKMNHLLMSSSNSKLIHVRRICRQDLKQENRALFSSDDSDSSTSGSSTTIRMNRKRREIARRRLVKERSSSFNTTEVCYNVNHYGRLFSPSIPQGMLVELRITDDDASVSSVSNCCEEESEALTYFDGSLVESCSES